MFITVIITLHRIQISGCIISILKQYLQILNSLFTNMLLTFTLCDLVYITINTSEAHRKGISVPTYGVNVLHAY
jgi:hypothetical protein